MAPATDAIQIRSSVGTYATGAACGRPSGRVVARTAYVHCSMKASISSASSADRSGYESLVAADAAAIAFAWTAKRCSPMPTCQDRLPPTRGPAE